MSSKKTRLILPDSVYGNQDISKFINYLMEEGKKSVAEKIFYTSMNYLVQSRVKEDKTLTNAQEILTNEEKKRNFVNSIFLEILNNIRPLARLKTKRVGGANYQVPTEITKEVSMRSAMKSIINVARKKSGKPMAQRLFEEFLNILNKEGDAVKQKNEMEKRIEANKAFSHFA